MNGDVYGRDRVAVTYERYGDGIPYKAWVPAAGRDSLHLQGRLIADHGDEGLYAAQQGVRDGLVHERTVAMLTAAERGSAEILDRSGTERGAE